MIDLDRIDRQTPQDLGVDLMGLIRELYPICRSITGDGVRQTLRAIQKHVPLTLHEVPSGTQVFDWTVPREWNIRDAFVADATGRRVIDFGESNLHVVNYSVPVDRKMSLAELKPHLHTLPEHPDWIPYRTTYYREAWGFCLRHRDLEALPAGDYHVRIDATLEDGHLTYGELLLPGQESGEVLLTTHVCHPSMCNDNLSGIAVLTALARLLEVSERRYSYRLLFMPGTIGAITWLARNRESVGAIRHGIVMAGLGDRGNICYKRSRRGDAEVDHAVAHVLHERGVDHRMVDFSPYGYDERQFCSPGFNLPVGRFSRSEYATYPQYHTSADDPEFVSSDALADSFSTLARVLAVLDANRTVRSTSPFCEPQLGPRGLYDDFDAPTRLAFLWVLNLADGEHSLLDVAERSGMEFQTVAAAAAALQGAGLLEPNA